MEWPFRHLQMLDLDGVPLPQRMSVITGQRHREMGCRATAPAEFGDASFVYELSASAGLTKKDHELNVHLVYTEQTPTNQELRTWARWWNAKQRQKIIDPALFTEVQPHYTNNPELLEGLIDPLAGRRLGLITRRRRTVDFYMPSEAEVAEELGARKQRAAGLITPSKTSLSAKDNEGGKNRARFWGG